MYRSVRPRTPTRAKAAPTMMAACHHCSSSAHQQSASCCRWLCVVVPWSPAAAIRPPDARSHKRNCAPLRACIAQHAIVGSFSATACSSYHDYWCTPSAQEYTIIIATTTTTTSRARKPPGRQRRATAARLLSCCWYYWYYTSAQEYYRGDNKIRPPYFFKIFLVLTFK